MIISSQIVPSPLLSPFVRCYTYREFDTNESIIIKPKHATPEIVLQFFFNALPLTLTDTKTGRVLQIGSPTAVSGLASQCVGEMTFKGFYSFFEIAFRPYGFQALFNIPSSAIIDQIVQSRAIFSSDIELLHEQLHEAGKISQMGTIADAYLLHCLKKRNRFDEKDRMMTITNSIAKSKGLLSVDKLAYSVNMSIRNFERHFTQVVGIPPKLFCRITRFNHVLDVKLRNPQLHWTDIAYQTGYFDQMHLIKDFKKFSGDAPATL